MADIVPFKTAYGPKPRVKVEFKDKSLTIQSEADGTDINKILKRAEKTGIITHIAAGVAKYGDFTTANEYQEAVNFVAETTSFFEALPAEIRKSFDNDPGTFFEFAGNPANAAKMRELGLSSTPPVVGDADYVEPIPEPVPNPVPEPTP